MVVFFTNSCASTPALRSIVWMPARGCWNSRANVCANLYRMLFIASDFFTGISPAGLRPEVMIFWSRTLSSIARRASTSGSAKLIIRKLAQAGAPDAYLFLSDFCVSQKFFSRLHAKLWLALMYWFFRATARIDAKRLVDPTRELEANGFACLWRSRWRFGFVKSELWQLCRDSIRPEDALREHDLQLIRKQGPVELRQGQWSLPS